MTRLNAKSSVYQWAFLKSTQQQFGDNQDKTMNIGMDMDSSYDQTQHLRKFYNFDMPICA